ncbi:MAG: hypothetical protein PHU46_13760 [Rhodocyclaceae bacterium]|nr:hypothetical protein [Rhodocyclaceae bacterium]
MKPWHRVYPAVKTIGIALNSNERQFIARYTVATRWNLAYILMHSEGMAPLGREGTEGGVWVNSNEQEFIARYTASTRWNFVYILMYSEGTVPLCRDGTKDGVSMNSDEQQFIRLVMEFRTSELDPLLVMGYD